jgi:hypothetical protein
MREIEFGVTDDAGSEARTGVYVPDGFTKADYEEFAASKAGLIDSILAGRVFEARLCIAIDLGGLAGNVAAAGSDVEEVGAFTFDSVNQRKVSINLPTFDESKVLPGTRKIDTTDTDVVAFVTAMETGVSTAGGTIQPQDSRGNDIDTLKFAKESVRSSR